MAGMDGTRGGRGRAGRAVAIISVWCHDLAGIAERDPEVWIRGDADGVRIGIEAHEP